MSTEVTTAQMNYVIGVFDGKSFMGSHITDYCADTAPKMKYHTDWGLLMRVIEKLKDRLYEIWNSSQIYEQPQIEISLNTNTIKLVDVETGWCLIDPISKDTLKETVYHACYEIIKWLNQQKQTNDERGTNKG